MSIATRDRLENIASGFMPARVLLTAIELDVFTAIGEGEVDAVEVAKQTRARVGPMERLLNALVGIGLLTKRKGLFKNTASGLTHLTANAPEPLRHIMQHRGNIWRSWSQLTEVVRKGKTNLGGRSKKREEEFVRGMADVGIVSAASTARLLKHELKSARRLLDLGGAPGVYGCEFARSQPYLKVTVLDLPGPAKIARETIKGQGMTERVHVKQGDMVKDKSYGRDYDIVFMSNVLHVFKAPQAREVVRKAAAALKPTGHLIIKDFYIQRDGTAPTFCALFSINMLVADAGDCFSRSDVEEWFKEAGLTPAGLMPVAKASSILIGVKE
jgi:2-polyprenyl-3-methyl-5-hydroxy-6-metoxy-1,4-benzoquinol methylase